MMRICDLIDFLGQYDPQTTVSLEYRISDGDGSGRIYEATDIRIEYRSGKVTVSPLSSKTVGGW